MAVKKVESFNLHETPAINQNEFDVETYLNANWGKTKEAVNNNAEELMQAQKDISTLKEDNKTNKSSIDVLEKSNETRDGKISKNAEDIEAIQGSIKTAIETINKKDNEQDEDIKANKESIEELKAENLEIKVENERLRNDIKSIAVVGEESGENIHIEDSSNARCEIEIGGNQKQETRSGKNLSKVEKISTVNGGYINASSGILATVEKGETYAISLNCSSKHSGTNVINVRVFVEDSYYVQTNLNYSSGNRISRTFVASNSGELSLSANLGTDYTDVLYDIQLEKGTSATDYEQYGASPSIDYPSKVKSVGNIKNILDMSNAKGGTSGGITCTMNKDGSYTYKGTASSKAINIWLLGSYTDNTSIFRLEPGTYYIDGVVLFDGNNALANPDIVKIFTFINAHDITGVRALDAVSGNTYDETKYPIIAKIDHEIPWIPYDCGYAKVDIVNENIFNTENVKSTSEVSVVDNKNGVLELQGVNGFWKGITTTQKFETGKRVYVKCKFVQGTGSSGNIGIKDTNGDDILENYKVSNNLISCSFISKGITKIFFRCNGTSNNGNIKYSDIMFSYEDIDYIPHQEQSYLVDVQQEMLEGDYLDLENEKEHHEWGKYIFTGDEDYNKSQTYSNEKYFCGWIPSLVVTNIKLDKKGLCNCFRRFGDFSTILDEECIRIWGQFQVRILASHLTENSAEAFKTWLKSKYDEGNPVVVYYPLATPVELDFTEAQKAVAKKIKSEAHTYKNITNISAESSEVNPIASVKYLKDAETEHNKLQAQIDEIKQLLSTTETSALLVNNLEKDLRMEV